MPFCEQYEHPKFFINLFDILDHDNWKCITHCNQGKLVWSTTNTIWAGPLKAMTEKVIAVFDKWWHFSEPYYKADNMFSSETRWKLFDFIESQPDAETGLLEHWYMITAEQWHKIDMVPRLILFIFQKFLVA